MVAPLAMLLLIPTVTAQGADGGTIFFANRSLPARIDAPVFAEDGTTPLEGMDFVAELWAGPDLDSLAPVSWMVPFGTGMAAGYWSAGSSAVVYVPSVAPGATAFVQVRVWEVALGATYEEARASGGRIGKSIVMALVTGGAGTPPSLPANLVGLTPFRLGDDPPAPLNAGADLDGDGQTDILWQHSTGLLSAWMMDGTALSKAAWLSPMQVSDPDWRIVGMADFNGDGKPDILWRHSRGWLSVWFMNGTTLQTSVLLSPSQISDTNWAIVATGDFNQDGQPDILWRHTDGSLSAWLMNRTSLARAVYLTPRRVTDPNWRIVGTGDFNRDGKVDILWQHSTGWLSVWYMNGTTLSNAVYLSPSCVSDTNWKVVAVGDFNHDGQADLLWRHSDGSLSVWLMDGVKLRQPVYLKPPRVADPNWVIVGPK
jgi:hypothetical protein